MFSPRSRPSAALLDGVGWTGLLIAGLRAEESQRPDALFDDPFAAAVVSIMGERSNLGSTQWSAGGGRASELAEALREYVGVRVRFVDDAIAAAASAGVKQIVLLGAGLDGRFYRLPLPEATTLFEVDLPEVVDAKDHLASLAGLGSAVERRSVRADLRRPWAAALEKQGHQANEPTLWVAEGILFYLSRQDCDALMRTVRELSASGSRLATEFPDAGVESVIASVGTEQTTRHAAAFMQGGPGEDPVTWLARFDFQSEATALTDLMASYGRPSPDWATRADSTWWMATATLAERS